MVYLVVRSTSGKKQHHKVYIVVKVITSIIIIIVIIFMINLRREWRDVALQATIYLTALILSWKVQHMGQSGTSIKLKEHAHMYVCTICVHYREQFIILDSYRLHFWNSNVTWCPTVYPIFCHVHVVLMIHVMHIHT